MLRGKRKLSPYRACWVVGQSPTVLKEKIEIKDVTMFELADGTIKRELVFFGSVKFGKENKNNGKRKRTNEDWCSHSGRFN